MSKDDLKEFLKEKSEGILSNLTDALLWTTFFTIYPSSYGRAGWEKSQAADNLLSEVNYQSIKVTFYNLKKKGLVDYVRGKTLEPKITSEGKERLASLTPKYHEKRTWSGRVYLVTYDIPEKKRGDRDKLRSLLVKLGCGQLQASVYLSPFNPKGALKEFIEERELSGWIIISDIGKDGSVGGKSLQSLIIEVYSLEVLNERYNNFIRKYEKGFGQADLSELAFSFYSILVDDPQLPFELLPYWWKGNRAYRLFKRLAVNKIL
ncbi:CRISPR-associated endonuclease Cas2 [Candidatus Microgenomates bacterium]|nr:CRISPR-associated endonuclease Cas2 [Candidatus Microgenomates bacterium]